MLRAHPRVSVISQQGSICVIGYVACATSCIGYLTSALARIMCLLPMPIGHQSSLWKVSTWHACSFIFDSDHSCSSQLSFRIFSYFARVVSRVFCCVRSRVIVLGLVQPEPFQLKSQFLFVSTLVKVLSVGLRSYWFRFDCGSIPFVSTLVVLLLLQLW